MHLVYSDLASNGVLESEGICNAEGVVVMQSRYQLSITEVRQNLFLTG